MSPRGFADSQRPFVWIHSRISPFSIWDWRQYHARGIPNLHAVQLALEALLLVGAAVAPFVLRRAPSPVRLAGLSAALLIGFQLVLTHWFYLYIPWFFPFVAFTVLAPTARVESAHVEQPERREPLVAA